MLPLDIPTLMTFVVVHSARMSFQSVTCFFIIIIYRKSVKGTMMFENTQREMNRGDKQGNRVLFDGRSRGEVMC